MYEIPTKIFIEGEEFPIRNNGDYRMVLDCFKALQDAELNPKERVFCSLLIFYEDINSIADINKFPDLETAIKEMYNFFNCGKDQSVGKHMKHRLIDWDKDSQMICSAINKVANKEVRAEPYIHWWTFMGYYSAVGESLLSTVLSIRDKLSRGKKLEKYEREFKNENPEYFVWNARTTDDEEADRLFDELWNNGGAVDG
jgi:hypothetical protein